jgi:hypothetical protein
MSKLQIALIIVTLAVIAFVVADELQASTGVTCGFCMITNDPTTWPSGDKIWNICQAIAKAEGAAKAGSVPDQANNPGDITDGIHTYGSFGVGCSNVTNFPTKQIGWNALYAKISNIVSGSSTSYCANWTWNQIAQTWATKWQPWVTNVTGTLGVDPTSTLEAYVNG